MLFILHDTGLYSENVMIFKKGVRLKWVNTFSLNTQFLFSLSLSLSQRAYEKAATAAAPAVDSSDDDDDQDLDALMKQMKGM